MTLKQFTNRPLMLEWMQWNCHGLNYFMTLQHQKMLCLLKKKILKTQPLLTLLSLLGRARWAVVPSAWCLHGPWPPPSFHCFPGNNGFGRPDEYWSPSSRWLYFICWPHKRGCWRAECQPRPLCHVMECYQKATRLALSFLLNKQLNHSLLVIKILSWSHVL